MGEGVRWEECTTREKSGKRGKRGSVRAAGNGMYNAIWMKLFQSPDNPRPDHTLAPNPNARPPSHPQSTRSTTMGNLRDGSGQPTRPDRHFSISLRLSPSPSRIPRLPTRSACSSLPVVSCSPCCSLGPTCIGRQEDRSLTKRDAWARPRATDVCQTLSSFPLLRAGREPYLCVRRCFTLCGNLKYQSTGAPPAKFHDNRRGMHNIFKKTRYRVK